MTDCIIYLAAATSASISGCFVIQIQCPFILNLLQHSIESKHEVTILSGLNEFVVKFYGQQGSKSYIMEMFLSYLPINCLLVKMPF